MAVVTLGLAAFQGLMEELIAKSEHSAAFSIGERAFYEQREKSLSQAYEYAPNVPGAVEHRQVLSPVDLERVYGLTGGNIMKGAMHFHQLFMFRPVPGWSDACPRTRTIPVTGRDG